MGLGCGFSFLGGAHWCRKRSGFGLVSVVQISKPWAVFLFGVNKCSRNGEKWSIYAVDSNFLVALLSKYH